MNELLNLIAENFIIIAGSILTATLSAHLVWRNNFNIRRANACAAFRSAVLKSLSGIYPPVEEWPENISASLIATIPAIKSACAEFEPYVSRFRRKKFLAAYWAYEQQCRQEQPFNMVLLHYVYPDRVPNHPQDVFCQHVERLLKFANKK